MQSRPAVQSMQKLMVVGDKQVDGWSNMVSKVAPSDPLSSDEVNKNDARTCTQRHYEALFALAYGTMSQQEELGMVART